jgi:asparagine synthase (glutamine-hydrolysing)
VCGIYGYVGEDRSLGAQPTLERAVAALWHRGPDDRGTFHESAGPLSVGFAHTRLKIIDLSDGGRQPMSTADGRYTIVYNGEVYNHVQIRNDLLSLGEQFHSTCDTEVVLKAYARWGKGALARFRGMFAFAIWDARDRALFVARDRLGVKPLYYIERGHGIAFASEVRALLATGAAPRELCPRAIASYFAFGAVSGGDAIAAGARALPPGHTLELKGGRITVSRYWQLPIGRVARSSFNDEIEGLRPILREAVRLRLIADVPVGIFLSGGIDSSVLVALATKAEDAPVHTFTVTFDEESYSEAPYAAEVARRFGCTHQQVHLPAARAAQEIDAAVRALDQPAEDGINTYFVSKAARAAGLAVALSGLGGDELFAGYASFRSFRQAIAVGRTAEHVPQPLLRSLASVAGLGFAPNRARKLAALLATAGRPDEVYAVLRAMFTPEQCRELLAPAYRAKGAHESLSIPDGLLAGLADQSIDPINAYSTLDLSNYLVNTLLRDSDVMSMAHGLEVRVPLIDHVLVERVLRIEGALKLRDHENKPLLTAAVPGLPRSAISRRKMGFTLPFNAWFRGALRPWMEEMLLGDPVKRLGFLEPRAVERLWRSFLRGESFISHSRIWCIASLAGWCQNNGISA